MVDPILNAIIRRKFQNFSQINKTYCYKSSVYIHIGPTFITYLISVLRTSVPYIETREPASDLVYSRTFIPSKNHLFHQQRCNEMRLITWRQWTIFQSYSFSVGSKESCPLDLRPQAFTTLIYKFQGFNSQFCFREHQIKEKMAKRQEVSENILYIALDDSIIKVFNFNH